MVELQNNITNIFIGNIHPQKKAMLGVILLWIIAIFLPWFNNAPYIGSISFWQYSKGNATILTLTAFAIILIFVTVIYSDVKLKIPIGGKIVVSILGLWLGFTFGYVTIKYMNAVNADLGIGGVIFILLSISYYPLLFLFNKNYNK